MTFKHVAVIGAGAMGAGIAQVMAASMEVVLIDVSEGLVEKGVAQIRRRCESDVQKGKITAAEKDRIVTGIKGAVDLRTAQNVDLVVEAVIEDRKVKADLFHRLHGICRQETVFATNTSTLSVTDLGTLSGRSARFVGLHFFNPVPVMKLVEVIPTLGSEDGVVQDSIAAMKKIGKTPILSQDCPGFIVNRVLPAYVGEALLCAQEGVSPEAIDQAARKAGFPMGPLEMTDFVGVDVSLYGTRVIHGSYGDRFPIPEILWKLFEAGHLGVKTGKGIYHEGKIDDGFRRMVKEIGTEGGDGGFTIERCLLRGINEAIYCLQEGVASAGEIDRALILGAGFPNRGGIGGPLHLADEMGLDRVLSILEDLTAHHGTRFWPHHLLKTYVAANRLGRKTGEGFFTY